MKTSRWVSGLAVGVLSVGLAGNAPGYQIFKPNPVGQGVPPSDYLINARPTASPPFVHWDLREMPGCAIPWSHVFPVPDIDRNGTPDQAADRAAAANAFTAAWTSWDNVNPAVVSFVLGSVGAAVGGRRGIALDGFNISSFVGPPHDDQQCVALNAQAPAPGGIAANRPFAPVVAPGPDGLLATLPGAAPSDDQASLCIAAGANNNSNSVAVTGDDVQVIPVGNPAAAGAIIVNAGPDGILQTAPQGDDVVVGGNTIRESVVAGNGTADTPVADDVQIVANGAGAGGCSVVVTAGPNGSLETPPGGDDIIRFCVVAGANGNCNTIALSDGLVFPGAAQDDVQNIAVGGAAAANAVVVGPGGDGVLTTAPRGDDVIVGNTIREPAAGGNGLADTDANNQTTIAGIDGMFGSLGLTGVFFNNKTGVLIEADVEFNASTAWSINAHNAAPAAGTIDLQQVTTHEYGHCLGIAHPVNGRTNDDTQNIAVGGAAGAGAVVVGPGPDGALATQPQGDDLVVGNAIEEPAAGGNGLADTPSNNAFSNDPPPANIMNPIVQGPPVACNQQLSADDAAAANFLYTPDLGDAPNPYQTGVRNAAGTGRTLSGMVLASPRTGAMVLLAHPSDYAVGGGQVARFEWLGADEDGAATECEPLQNDRDQFDDGMIIPNPLARGVVNRIRALVNYNDPGGRYIAANPSARLYFNGYFDFNANGTFDGADHIIWWAGVPGATSASSANFVPGASNLVANPMVLAFDVIVPAVPIGDIYARARLDYGEDEGRVAAGGTNGDLAAAVGVQQFGEVEDYKVRLAVAGPIDSTHYWSYSFETPKDTLVTISARDQFISLPMAVDTLTRLVNWVHKNHSFVRDTTLHFTWWNIRDKYPVHVFAQITNQFGVHRVKISNLEFLLAPALKNDPATPEDSVSHYLCYQALGFPGPVPEYDLEDEWRTDRQHVYDMKYLCVPCWKTHNGLEYAPVDSITHLAVYEVHPQSEPFRPLLEDQFVTGAFRVQQRSPREYLFVPSTKEVIAADVSGGGSTGPPLGVSPNPIRTNGEIEYSVSRRGEVQLEIFGIDGRRVRSLHRGVREPGAYHSTWDGTDEHGVRVSSGVYFLRLQTSDVDVTRRIVYVR